MKHPLTCILALFVISQSFAQTDNGAKHKRHVRFKVIGVDSVIIPLNSDYYRIEDSCAQIMRYGHYNRTTKKYNGKFTDVSKADSDLVVSQGTYTANGLKEGEFECYYLNGALQSKGNFKNNILDGKWELYYSDGRPELTFEASGNDIRIIDEWDTDGKKVIDNGKGEHVSNIGEYYWIGKVAAGKPDGTWKFMKAHNTSSPAQLTESFKKGLFKKGTSPIGDYTDSSRIVLISPDLFPFLNAEKMHISREACDGSGRKLIVHAQYPGGKDAFVQRINVDVRPFLKRYNISRIQGQIFIEGEVNEKGTLGNLHSTQQGAGELARDLILGLNELPLLEPATIDNKPVTEKFSIIFTFIAGMYKIHYRFFPLKNN